MRSHAQSLHSGPALALFSAAPSLLATITTRELIANCRVRVSGGDCLRYNPELRCGGGSLNSGTSVSQWVIRRVRCGVRGLGSGDGCGDRLTASSRGSRDAVVVMHRLLVATERRIIPLEVRQNTKRCIACGSSNTTRNGAGGEDYEEKKTELEDNSPPQDAVLKAISEVSKAEGRVGKTTNLVIGGTVKKDAESEWNAIDQKVNVYPMVRDFTAIGTGGDEFVQAMVQAVESITETPVPKVTKKLSSQGTYIAVKIAGITVISSDQVRAVYDAMRKDLRMKYFL